MGKSWRGGREKWPIQFLSANCLCGRKNANFTPVGALWENPRTDLSRKPRLIAGYHETPQQPILPQRTLYRILFYWRRWGKSSKFPQKYKNGVVWFACTGRKILKKLGFAGFAYGKIAQKWRKTVKTGERENNLIIFRWYFMSATNGHITISRNQKDIKTGQSPSNGAKRIIFLEKL